jgi:3-polyprenyl-4-hydroxybenzoate decarboxylase
VKRALSGPLDPALKPGEKQYNSRLLIDATKPWEWRDAFPTAIGPSPEIKAATRKRWGYLLDHGVGD